MRKEESFRNSQHVHPYQDAIAETSDHRAHGNQTECRVGCGDSFLWQLLMKGVHQGGSQVSPEILGKGPIGEMFRKFSE